MLRAFVRCVCAWGRVHWTLYAFRYTTCCSHQAQQAAFTLAEIAVSMLALDAGSRLKVQHALPRLEALLGQ